VPIIEIENRTISPVSMMPEGILDKLSIGQVRDLVAYLAGPVQVPEENANLKSQNTNHKHISNRNVLN
jgi:hypothetical protein